MSQLTHLSLFATDRASGAPVARMPFYAEIGLPADVEPPPVENDQRFQEQTIAALDDIDPDCAQTPTCRTKTIAVATEVVARILSKNERDKVIADPNLARKLMTETLSRVRSVAGAFAPLDPEVLRQRMLESLAEVAKDLGIPVQEIGEQDRPIIWAYPLGVLATDHVGYLSFELTHLPSAVLDAIAADIEARKKDASANLRTAVLLYPLVSGANPLNATAQARFAEDAIVARIELDKPALPMIVKHLGMLAMQRPSLTDWRLSPSSFALNPSALLGEAGCENLFPANLAVQEFYFYDVIRLADKQNPIPPDLHNRVRLGLVNDYSTAWYPLGHSLGQILYSLPLAPGESVNLAVIDWTRRDKAQRSEDTKVNEQLVHNEHRDRSVTETVNAALQERQHGSSFMAGLAASAGVSAALGGTVGLAGGLTGSLGGSTATSDGARNITANTVQNVNDSISQISSATRELQSTVVVQSNQEEKEAIETRTVVNYNHSHALTILYYEVLRHYRVVTRRTGRDPAVLVKYDVVTFDEENILCYRKILESVLVDDRLKPGFDAVERLSALEAEQGASSSVVTFNWFYFSMKTGGWFPNNAANVSATVVILSSALKPIAKLLQPIDVSSGTTPGTSDNLLEDLPSPAGGDTTYTFPAVPDKPVRWSDIYAFAFSLDVRKKSGEYLGVTQVKIAGVSADKVHHDLFEWNGDIALHDAGEGSFGSYIELAKLPDAAVTPFMSLKPEERQAIHDLLAHLNCAEYKLYYNRALWLNEDPYARAARFDTIGWNAGSSLLDHIENRPAEIIGQWVAFRSADAALDAMIRTLDEADARFAAALDWTLNERLVTLPTRGIFAEAKLGHCNASEEIDNTRFWDWQQSPIPHLAPEIAPVTAVTPQPQQPNVQPTPFPQSLVNIVNPPAAPDPTGLAAALNVLATPNIFRDMSGQAQVDDLLKKLSDNTIGIAQAANMARQIQAKYGSTAPALSLGGPASGGFGARTTPTQPSATTSDLGNFRQELKQGVKDGLLPSEQAGPAYTKAVNRVADGEPLSTSDPGALLAFDVPDPSEWRDLARKNTPFAQWSREQKLRAVDDRVAALKRLLNGDYSQKAADDETLQLLEPYKNDMRDFSSRIAKVVLSASPFGTSTKGTSVTLSADVFLPSGQSPGGRIIFKAGILGINQLGTTSVTNGKASFTTTALPVGMLRLVADYPDQNVAGIGDIIGDSDEISYEVT